MHQFKIYTYIASKKKAHFHDSSYVKQVSSLQVLPHLSVHPCAAGDLLFCSSLAVSDKNRFSGQWPHVVVESRTGPTRYRARLYNMQYKSLHSAYTLQSSNHLLYNNQYTHSYQ